MSVTKSKYWNGRKAKSEKIISAGSGKVEFGAAIEAQIGLNDRGYVIGSLDDNNPIGFWYNEGQLQAGVKWHTISKEDKAKLDGVLVSEDFRTANVKIIFFK